MTPDVLERRIAAWLADVGTNPEKEEAAKSVDPPVTAPSRPLDPEAA